MKSIYKFSLVTALLFISLSSCEKAKIEPEPVAIAKAPADIPVPQFLVTEGTKGPIISGYCKWCHCYIVIRDPKKDACHQ